MTNQTPPTTNNLGIWPEDAPNRKGYLRILSDRLLYSYMGDILRKGSQLHRQRKLLKERESTEDATDEDGISRSKNAIELQNALMDQELSNEDLYEAPKTMHSDHLIKEFRTAFAAYKKEMETKTNATRSNDSNQTQGQKQNIQNKARSRVLMKVLWTLAKPSYIPAGMYQLVTVIVQTMTPLVVQQLLIQFEENEHESILSTQGVIFAFVLFICSITDGIAQERHKFLAFQAGITIRAATVNAIYDQMLQLSAKGKESLLTGETTNLVAIECQKLFEVTQEGHLVWSCPLSMVIVTVLLLVTLGKATLVGMASMIIFVPLVKFVVSKMMAIRKKRAVFTDRRAEVTTSMLQAIRFCKLNNYEEKFIGRVHDARKSEMHWIQRELSVLGWTLTLTVLTPVIASAVTFMTYAVMNGGNVLTSSETFTTLLLFMGLRFPINYVGKLIGKAGQGLEAVNRIADFLSRETTDDVNTELSLVLSKEEPVLRLENGSFTVGKNKRDSDSISSVNSMHDTDDEKNSVVYDDAESSYSKGSFTLSNINLSVKKSEVHCIVGPVASGKSTLLHGLIGDVPATDQTFMEGQMKLTMNGSLAFASQSPFILNSTVRENILFGNEYKEDLYDRVIEACNLLPDLKQLGAGRDLTEIGERGVTLSGGQKARLSIARCVYAQPSIALFDDVLSALDAATGKKIFENLFDTSSKNPDRLLSNSAVVLVTHATHFLSRVNNITVLLRGSSIFSGTWDQMSKEMLSADTEAMEVLTNLRASVQEANESSIDVSKKNRTKASSQKLNAENADEHNDALMSVEEREFGLSDLKTWFTWFKYAGGLCFTFSAFTTLAIDRGFYVITELWLAAWTAAAYDSIVRLGVTFTEQSAGLSAQYVFIQVYAVILGISFVATAVRSQIIIQGGARCAHRLFLDMTNRVIRAPMSYFETTPTGRILNRLTYDVEVLDISLSVSMSILMISSGWFITGLVIQISILPYSVCVLVPVISIYWLILLYYRKSAVDLQRLDAVSRSPVQAKLTEGMDGCTTIRTFGKSDHFQTIFKSTVDENTAAMLNFMASQRWLGSRFQVLGSIVVLFVTIFVVAFNDRLRLDTGIIAMLIIWSYNFTITLGFFSQGVSESEAYITSVERLQEMTRLPQEDDPKNVSVETSWPKEGQLSFENVCLRYRPGLPLALNGLTFSASPGQRVGICGRTGAGKSTIAAALFRLCNIEGGKISLDGKDLSTLSLSDVRGRKNGMCIIPQDPVLFSGSLRECLDPWGYSSDAEILEALKLVQVAEANTRGLIALEDFVDEGGRNYSVGERQLLCLARAVLAKPKVLVLDEATASVDTETDAFIQQMIRERFQGTTLLTIAHRLNTIMDYDVVLVMDKGKVAEFDSPKKLLENDDGIFTSLVDSTGNESSAVLRQMAESAS